MNNINDLDLAYLAGLIDGEGWITINKRSVRKNGKIYSNHYMAVGIANTNKDVLVWVQVVLGFGSVCKKSRQGNRKQGWQFLGLGPNAAELCKKILPFLKIKNIQAEIVIKFQQTLGNREKIWQGKSLPEVVDIRDDMFKQIRTLNQRGTSQLIFS